MHQSDPTGHMACGIFYVVFFCVICFRHRLFGEVLPMCRRNQLLAVGAVGLGFGLLLACFFESGFFQVCVGAGLIVVGVTLLQRK